MKKLIRESEKLNDIFCYQGMDKLNGTGLRSNLCANIYHKIVSMGIFELKQILKDNLKLDLEANET